MWIALDDGAIHEGTGVTLVRIADEVLLVALGVTCGTPLECGGEASAAAAAQPGDVDLLDDVLLAHARGKDLGDCLVAVVRQIGVDAFRVNDAAMAQRHARLLGKELLFLRRDEQLVKQCQVAAHDRVIDGLSILLLHPDQAMQRVIVLVHVDDGLKEAHADAARNA